MFGCYCLFKQKTAYEMRISDWSSDVCSSDLIYLSVPEGFRLKLLSFFGTTKKGYVYKFGCRIEAIEAQQIFVSNPLTMAKTEAVTESEEEIGRAASRENVCQYV